tara:strand:+ start:10681 stop:11139 length:459 start_codon:yes stop_codon:yes gene_type:complete
MITRPTYESTTDKNFEYYFAKRYAKKKGLTAVKAPDYATPDWTFWDENKPQGDFPSFEIGLEIKTRHPRFRGLIAKGGLVLSASKWKKLLTATQSGWSVGVGISFGGKADFVYKLTGKDLPVHQSGGRTRDTRDRWDIEPVVYIPFEWFEQV